MHRITDQSWDKPKLNRRCYPDKTTTVLRSTATNTPSPILSALKFNLRKNTQSIDPSSIYITVALLLDCDSQI